MPNSTIHMHQALGRARSQAADIELQAREVLRENGVSRGILVKHTGQTDERIRKDFDRDSTWTRSRPNRTG
jgi:ATP-dependent Clp protease protease subunit